MSLRAVHDHSPGRQPLRSTGFGAVLLVAVLSAGAIAPSVATAEVGRGQASAAAPTNGRIVFARAICVSDEDPCWEIVAADPDGTHEVVLAGPYPRGVWDDHFVANWAPDGRSAIFMADLGGGQAIWSVAADGTGLHAILTAPVFPAPSADGNGFDDGPAYTPDGREIIFTRCCPQTGYSLWSVRPDGRHLHVVTTEAVGPSVDGPSDNLPQVSPDGRLIAFHRNADGNYVATVNLGGGQLRGLTDLELDAQIPNWSPDGTRLVFQAEGHVWKVGVDGTGLTQVTDDPPGTRSINPSYSPDGSRIIFAHVDETGRRDLFTMRPDGTDWAQVTDTDGDEFFPHWAQIMP